MKIEERIEFLVAEIKRHKDLYYNGLPEISDDEFDLLERELKALDPDNEVLTDVGAAVRTSPWPKFNHPMAMGSLEKCKDLAEYDSWKSSKISGMKVVLSEKIDGASLALYYKGGKLVAAATRGNGDVGENIYKNALRIPGVKDELPEPFTGGVRGEVVLFQSLFDKYLKDEFENPRNSASAIMKAKDGEHLELLNFIAYDIQPLEEF